MADIISFMNNVYFENKTDVVELSTSQFIAYMVIGIPSWLLYVLVIALLITSSNNTVFKTSYFKLAIIIGLAVGFSLYILITMIS